MENLSKQSKRESFRKTMVNQEKIFKYQVHELHRLYTVQKSLMTEINHQNLGSYSDGMQRLVRDEEVSRANFRAGTSTSDTSIGPKYSFRGNRGESANFDNHSDEESDDLDLTLSIGAKSIPKRETQDSHRTNSKQTGTNWLYQSLS